MLCIVCASGYQFYTFNAVSLTINQLRYSTARNGSLTLVCQTRGSPPTTNISWYRNGVQLDVHRESGLEMTVALTERSTSTFETTLQICQPGAILNGSYIFKVNNGLGTYTESVEIRGTKLDHETGSFTQAYKSCIIVLSI